MPLPAPCLLTVSATTACPKNALTRLAASIVTVQGPVPVHAPSGGPANAAPGAPTGVSVITWPLSNPFTHPVPQAIPAGVELTEPGPTTLTVKLNCVGCTVAKMAVTALSPLIVTWHEPVPVHAPDHPWKSHPWAGRALRFTVVPQG